MDNDRWNPNAQIVCPYDSLHIISVKRYQHHIIKCRKNHQDKDHVTCPFNAKHMILRHELKTHLAHCMDRVVLQADVRQNKCPETGEVLRLKGYTDLPEPRYQIVDDIEDWDNEIEENLAEKLEEQKLTTRRLYEENCGLRKPRVNEMPFQQKQINETPFRKEQTKDNEDNYSVCSANDGRSSVYVTPVKRAPGRFIYNTPIARTPKLKDQMMDNEDSVSVSSTNNAQSSVYVTPVKYASERFISNAPAVNSCGQNHQTRDSNGSYMRGCGRGLLSYSLYRSNQLNKQQKGEMHALKQEQTF